MLLTNNLYFFFIIGIMYSRVVIYVTMHSYKVLNTLFCIFFIIALATRAALPGQVAACCLKVTTMYFAYNLYFDVPTQVTNLRVVILITVHSLEFLNIPLVLYFLRLFNRQQPSFS